MNKSYILFCLCFALILTACSGGEVVSEIETPPPPVEAPQEAELPQEVAATPTLQLVEQTVDFIEPAAGTSMLWYDQNELVFVPSGEFVMGGQEDIPERLVSLSGFWINRYAVTNGMYRQCIDVGECDAPANEPPYPDTSDPEIKDNPVVGVTWVKAQKYCNWMDLRLPTEAEWEKAARGEDGNPYPWGEAEPTCDLSNYEGCRGKTSRVPDYPDGASPYGITDMAGNVFEWVGDWHNEDFSQLESEDPQGPDTGATRVIRSSSYKSGANLLPSALRFSLEPEKYREDLGFRCATQEPQGFAPYCQVASIPGANTPACQAPPEASLEVEHYCADRRTNLGGVRVHTVSDYYSSIYISGVGGPEGGDCFSDGDDFSTWYCVGPENSSVTVGYTTVCEAPAGVALVADVICPAGYEPAGFYACRFTGDTPPIMTSELRCPSGYGFDSEASSCAPYIAGELRCPAGYSFDASQSCCTLPGAGSDETLIDDWVRATCPPEYMLFPDGSGDLRCYYEYEYTESETTVTLGECVDSVPRDDGGDGGFSVCPPGQSLVCDFLTGAGCSCK